MSQRKLIARQMFGLRQRPKSLKSKLPALDKPDEGHSRQQIIGVANKNFLGAWRGATRTGGRNGGSSTKDLRLYWWRPCSQSSRDRDQQIVNCKRLLKNLNGSQF